MAYSKIQLQFNRRTEIGEVITFAWRDLDDDTGGLIDSQCQSSRWTPHVWVYASQTDPFYSMSNYIDAFEIDFNPTDRFVVSHGSQVMDITATKKNIEFYSFSSSAGVIATITNEAEIPNFLLEAIGYVENATNKCSEVLVTIDTSTPMEGIDSPVVNPAINNAYYEFVWARGSTQFLSVYDADGSRITATINTPAFLLEPTVDIVNTPSGATANGSLQTNLSGLTYSLDDITYQNASVFSGLLPGSFTMYVKDTYGCTKSTNFEVVEFDAAEEVDEPVDFISNTNSLRFKLNEIWDNISIYKNDNNTLSTEEKGTLVYPYIHKYQNTDKITTQVKTNFDTLSGAIVDCDGNETALTFIQKTNNLNKKDKRDALGFDFDDGRFGYYFISGNVYDYDATPVQTVIGTYELFGQLPAWGRIGQYLSVDDGAYYQIIDIVYVESIQAEVMVINSVLTAEPVTLSAIYNIFNWDAYEFDVDMASYPDQEIWVKINFDDATFDSKEYISEKIQTYALLEDYITIESRNTFNNEIVYQDGITHLLRLQYDEFGGASESEIEVEKTDQYVYSIDGKSYIKKKITFNYLSTKMEQKVRQILTLDDITIDGVGHTVDSIDQPERLGVTNLYALTCTVYEVGVKPLGTVVDTNVELDILDVPALIIGDDEFVKQ